MRTTHRLGLCGLLFALATGLGAATAQAQGELPPAARNGSTWDLIREEPELSIFAELADLAGLRDALDGGHALTVFIPGNAAFERLDEERRLRLRDPDRRDELRHMLGAHLMWGAVFSEDVSGVQMRRTLAGHSLVLSRGPAPVDAAGEPKAPTLVAGGATVTSPDRKSSNGVFHLVDVLLCDDEHSPGPLSHAPDCDSGDHSEQGGHSASGAGHRRGPSADRGDRREERASGSSRRSPAGAASGGASGRSEGQSPPPGGGGGSSGGSGGGGGGGGTAGGGAGGGESGGGGGGSGGGGGGGGGGGSGGDGGCGCGGG